MDAEQVLDGRIPAQGRRKDVGHGDAPQAEHRVRHHPDAVVAAGADEEPGPAPDAGLPLAKEAQEIHHGEYLAAMAGNTQEEGRGSGKGREEPGANDLEDILTGDREAQLTRAEAEEFLLGPGLAGDGSVGSLPKRTLKGSVGQGAKVSGG